jgi:bifunctional ADP-heptose synthase (sugar kinase/adenylyltransferase)
LRTASSQPTKTTKPKQHPKKTTKTKTKPKKGPGEEPLRQAAVLAPHVVDTTGAGDCFTAAYAVATLEGKAPRDALLFASAAASICVTRAGAMTSLPSREEVEALLLLQTAAGGGGA